MNAFKLEARGAVVEQQGVEDLIQCEMELDAFIKGVMWCDHPQRQGARSNSPKDPHAHPQIPLILLSFPLPTPCAFMHSAAPRFKSKGQRCNTKLETINVMPCVFIILHQ